MTFLERYKSGETVEVYADITELGAAAFTERYYADMEAVLTETMERTAHNLGVIYDELNRINYNFYRDPEYSFKIPLNKPLANASQLLHQLNNAVKPFGTVPLSIQLFYKFVGSCNFASDYEAGTGIFWEGADPVQIIPLDSLVEEVTNKDWIVEMQEAIEYGDLASLAFSADYLHKDNISGGPPYCIAITPGPSIDGKVLNEPNETTFVDYLRIITHGCGFGRVEFIRDSEIFDEYFEKVTPMLKTI